jgi:hypothetical protein
LPSIAVDEIEAHREDDIDPNEDNDLQIIRVDRVGKVRREAAQDNGGEEQPFLDVPIVH